MAIRLNKKNGLYKFVDTLVESGLDIFYNKEEGRAVIYYETLKKGVSYEQFKTKIADYIGRNMLSNSYCSITICCLL